MSKKINIISDNHESLVAGVFEKLDNYTITNSLIFDIIHLSTRPDSGCFGIQIYLTRRDRTIETLKDLLLQKLYSECESGKERKWSVSFGGEYKPIQTYEVDTSVGNKVIAFKNQSKSESGYGSAHYFVGEIECNKSCNGVKFTDTSFRIPVDKLFPLELVHKDFLNYKLSDLEVGDIIALPVEYKVLIGKVTNVKKKTVTSNFGIKVRENDFVLITKANSNNDKIDLENK